jgi:hypothetical protein
VNTHTDEGRAGSNASNVVVYLTCFVEHNLCMKVRGITFNVCFYYDNGGKKVGGFELIGMLNQRGTEKNRGFLNVARV